MKCLVLGGNGFIGSHLVEALVANGEKVRVFDRSSERLQSIPKGVEFVVGSLVDTIAMESALTGIDVVYHLISTTVPATSNLDPVADIEGNLISTVKLLELMRMASITRIVYLSSGGAVYGIPKSDPVPETHPLNPISSYGIVKVAVENYLMMEAHLHGLRPLILRASNPYGIRQGHQGIQGVIGTFLESVACKRAIYLWGDGTIVRDFIHVSDLVRLAVQAERAEAVGIFNAGSGKGHSICDIVEVISEVIGKPLDPIYQPKRGFDVPRVVLDVTRARHEIGWSAETDLRSGIADTWDWVTDKFDEK